MIKVHSKAAYDRYYDKFTNAFIDYFCNARTSGFSQEEAFWTAKIKMQDILVAEIVKNKDRAQVLYRLYRDLKNDQQLFEKALKKFNRNKYLK